MDENLWPNVEVAIIYNYVVNRLSVVLKNDIMTEYMVAQ